MPEADQVKRWRLILGQGADPDGSVPLEGHAAGMDGTLEALYGDERKGGLSKSKPRIGKWLGDIRNYFPRSVVRILQKDALERLDLKQMLLEPELLSEIECDPAMAATLLQLRELLPEQTKETARQIIRQVAKDIESRWRPPIESAWRGPHRADRSRRPRATDIDWHRTILANLNNYLPEQNTIVPERLRGKGRRQRQLKQMVLVVDQSASMATSMVYAAVLGSILASLPSLNMHFFAFDTQVVDLSEHLHDPVELLFAAQLGGGTDIAKAVQHSSEVILEPERCLYILISDLHEGGHLHSLLQRAARLREKGAITLALLALDDQGVPSYDYETAARFRALDWPCFACTPDQFSDLLVKVMSRQPLPLTGLG